MRSKWYQYSQNNSGGEWMGPAFEVYIEAHSPKNADNRAQCVGVHFDGVYRGSDCECCGDRWTRATYTSPYTPCREVPEPITLTPSDYWERYRASGGKVPYAAKFYLGTFKPFFVPRK